MRFCQRVSLHVFPQYSIHNTAYIQYIHSSNRTAASMAGLQFGTFSMGGSGASRRSQTKKQAVTTYTQKIKMVVCLYQCNFCRNVFITASTVKRTTCTTLGYTFNLIARYAQKITHQYIDFGLESIPTNFFGL